MALDTETDSLDEMLADIVGLSFSAEPGLACYIPLAHDYQGAPDQLPRDEVLARLKPWLENPEKKKLGQHVKYDRHVFANHGIEVRGYEHDTMLQSYVLEVHKPHGLASLAERHLGRTGIDYETIAGKGAHQIPFNQVPVDKAAEYSCEDSDQTLDVHLALWPKLERDAQAALHLRPGDAEQRGAVPRRAQRRADRRAGCWRSKATSWASASCSWNARRTTWPGQPFNLGSPKQIGEIFFTKLGLPVVKKTASGAPSTDEEVLEKLAEDYPLPAKLLEHRGLSKLKGTYTDKLPQMAHPRTGRVHTHYAQAVAVTGRLSSNDPNLQNIPIRTAEGRRIREAFIAPPGHRIASADYSQIELRIMAHISEDEALLRAFREGMDVHRATASEVFGVAPDEVSSEQRRYAKVINFGLIYGMSSFGLARNLGIETAAAKNYIERYFQRYPGVKNYMDETRAVGQEPRLRRDGVRPAPVPARDQFTQRPAPRRRRAAGHQRAHAGHGGRPDQAVDGARCRRCWTREQRAHEDDHAGARRTGVRGAGGRGRVGAGGDPAHHGGRGGTARAAAGGDRGGRELGRGALACERWGAASRATQPTSGALRRPGSRRP